MVEIIGESKNGSTMVNCVATLHWHKKEITFSCLYSTNTRVFSGFEWTNSEIFGEGAGGYYGYIVDVSISMAGKSYSETAESPEREVLDDLDNRLMFVEITFSADERKGMMYGKKVVLGKFGDCALSGDEKKRLRLE